MGTNVNPFSNVEGKCFISNYKPELCRNHKGTDINIWVNNGTAKTGGKISDRNMQNFTYDLDLISKSIASLKGNTKKLEVDDLFSIDKLIGLFGIKSIAKDLSAGVARITFDNGEELRIDFELENEPTDDNNIAQYSERDVELIERCQTQVEKLQADPRFSKKYDIEMEKNQDGAYTGNVFIKIKENTLAGDLSDYLEKHYGMQEGSILENNKEYLDSCDKKWTFDNDNMYDYKKLPVGSVIKLTYYELN